MYIVHIVAVVLFVYLQLIRSQDLPELNSKENPVTNTKLEGQGKDKAVTASDDDLEEEGDEEEALPKDRYTYVALLDIVFTDDCKRACTGAIIHDNVVITAAHCFTMLRDPYVQPELSMSFVIIGTKMMFDSGYEQYLPIERIITHPNFKGWTADLALVYTFANMMSEKPGAIIPIASARTQAPVDLNVTVLSWGRCKATKEAEDQLKKKKHKTKHNKKNKNSGKDGNILIGRDNKISSAFPETTTMQVRFKLKSNTPTLRTMQRQDGFLRVQLNEPILDSRSRYLTNNKINTRKGTTKDFDDYKNVPPIVSKKSKKCDAAKDKLRADEDDDSEIDEINYQNYTKIGNARRQINDSEYKEWEHDFVHSKFWRRQMELQHINLTEGIFGYVNLEACKKIVERSLPPMYEIRNKNEILCYSSEEFYITNEDSGAPVIQKDQLVAVTVGGVDSDGDHVAVGMKIACFCTWIAENLPNKNGAKIKCCKDCCDGRNPRARAHNRRPLRNGDQPQQQNKFLKNGHHGLHKFVDNEDDDYTAERGHPIDRNEPDENINTYSEK